MQYLFDLDVRDYNLWMWERTPVILVLYDAGRRRAYWIHVQDYSRRDPARKPPRNARAVRVRVPRRQKFDRRAIKRICELKQESQSVFRGISP